MFSEIPAGLEGCYQVICERSWGVWECMVIEEKL